MLSSQVRQITFGLRDRLWLDPGGCLALGDRQSIGLRESQEAFRIYGLGVLPNFHQKKLIMKFW